MAVVSLSRPERLADAGIAVGLLVAAALSTVLYRVAGVFGHEVAAGWLTALWLPFAFLPLALRRRFPITVAFVVSALFVVGQAVRVPELLIVNIALFLAIYTIGAVVDDRRRAFFARAVIVAGMMIWLLVSLYLSATGKESDDGLSREGAFSPLAAYSLLQVLINVLYFGAAWYFGDRARASAAARRELEARTTELEKERERSAAQAVALERLRIARELHDVVAHHVSAMGIQAGLARTVLTTDPAASRTAMEQVESTSRTAVDELHGLLFTLRDDPDRDAASTLGVRELPSLIERSREAGVPTALTVVGEARPLPSGLDVNLYRVAQEALTNVRKHAGPGSQADVRLRYLADAVELEIASTGHVGRSGTGGFGILGMRERIAASGGTLDAGPRTRGGWLVRAAVPTRAAERTRAAARAGVPDRERP